ncbi:MAG: bL17 family ribosomal protein, partial [Candidatus Acidiferrales bacterium]
VLKKLFGTLAPRFADRPGGYTRIVRVGWRRGDGGEMALIHLIGSELKVKEKKEKKRKKEAPPPEPVPEAAPEAESKE